MDNGIPPEMAMLQTIARLEQQLAAKGHELEAKDQELRDLSHEKRALEKTQRTLQMMAENVDDLIAVIDRTGKRIWNNPAYHRVLGYTPEDLEGTDSTEEIHPDDKEIVGRAFREAITQGLCSRIEYRMQHRNGSWVTLESQARAVNDSQGNPQYLVIVARDISSRKMMEEEQAKANRVSAMGVLAEGLAQEYNDVIASILLNLDQAKQNAPNGSIVAAKIADAERVAARAEEVTLRISEMTQQGDIEKKPLSLEPIVRDMAGELTRLTLARPEFAFSPEAPAALVNEQSVHRVINNLILNAVQSMRSRGIIRISLEPVLVDPRAAMRAAGLAPGQYLKLEIRDQGAGMTQQTLAKVFEPYFTTKSGHTGLGLTTALSVAKNHGGTIILQSTENVGTSATVYFPAADQSAVPEVIETRTDPTVASGRILVMDDEKIVADFLQLALQNAGYEVTTTLDGAQTIAAYLKARAQKKPYDLLIMDLHVPNGVGGQDALNTLLQFDPGVCAVLSTGKVGDLEWDHPEKYGAVSLLKKPYALPVLKELVAEILMMRQATGPVADSDSTGTSAD
jgi:PAS domain S-box-containing protein